MTEKTVDRWFSKFIRLRDCEDTFNGVSFGYCCTCGNTVTVYNGDRWNSSAHAGHFIGRYFKSTRFDEQNVNLQCEKCNSFAEGKQFEHSIYINRIHGPGTAEKILIKSKQLCKRNRYDFQKLTEYYRFEAKKLAKERGIKL